MLSVIKAILFGFTVKSRNNTRGLIFLNSNVLLNKALTSSYNVLESRKFETHLELMENIVMYDEHTVYIM